MRVLLSTIGSRGDVQPMVALALQLRELGQEVCICAPPDFQEWIGTLGIPFVRSARGAPDRRTHP
jgi:vancomycin aglycone glucosyltransferase